MCYYHVLLSNICAHAQDAFPYVDLLTRDLALAAKSVQFSYGLTDAGLANAISTVEPLFGVNSECLAACDVQG